jgi:hypothetical protein
MMLADLDPPLHQLRREEHDERIAWEFLELGSLVAVANVLERQRVKAKGLREQLEVGLPGVLDIEPEALLSRLQTGEQALGRGIQRRAVGGDEVPDRALSFVARAVRQVGRRGARPRRLCRLPT